MRLLRLEGVPIYRQLQIEEALLRADEGDWCLINTGAPPAIVMGISGNEEELLHREAVSRHGIPIIRRYSGGGTVVVDEETLFITLIGSSALLEGPCFPEPIMRWAEGLLAPVIPGLKLRENDFVIGERKVAGNAQYIRKGRFCHHLTLLWDYSEERMATLKLPKRRPTYRADRDHGSFLTRLKEYLPSKEALLKTLEEHLSARFGSTSVPLAAVEPLLACPHRQSTRYVLLQ
ncbi:MAG: lipoate--protein ligase family protein [Parachlamydiales bacterium]